MCFSATASFVASGVLLPLGAATLTMAHRKGDRQALPLAVAPLVFSLQQALEGMVWLGLDTPLLATGAGSDSLTMGAVLAYLFFAFAFWPVWMPWSAVRLWPETHGFRAPWPWIPALGFVPGALLWLPLVRHPQAALPHQIGHSLVYPLHPWSAGLLPDSIGQVLYATWIVIPLVLVPSARVRIFGISLLLAFATTQWASGHALTSIWCYASALLSVQILWILQGRNPLAKGATPAPATAHSQA